MSAMKAASRAFCFCRLIAPYARSDRELRPGWTAGGFLAVEPDKSFCAKWVNDEPLELWRKTVPGHI